MKKILTKPCLQCGKTITKPYNESLKNWENRHKFCSRSCLGLYHNFGLKTRFKPGSIPVNKGTKGVMKSNSGSFKKGRKLSESERQKLQGRTPWNKGKRHPAVMGSKNSNWKGGITKLNVKIRHSPEMAKWRIEIFKRDNYTCIICLRKRESGDRVILNADHYPKPFYKILEENNITTFDQAIFCEELWSIENGRTLCVECHLPTKGVNQYTK